MRVGSTNLITDVQGLLVGNSENRSINTGTTVLTSEQSFVAGVHVMGGAPGTQETDLLAPDRIIQKVDAIVLSGGSVYSLESAAGIVESLHKKQRGYKVNNELSVPIVPAAILFDLLNGGDKSWSENPYKKLGYQAFKQADEEFSIGSSGAGFGATTFGLRGGLGSASAITQSGYTVGALVVVNSLGTAVQNGGPHFWAAPFEIDDEFGGLGPSSTNDPYWELNQQFMFQQQNTTIAIVATDAKLDQAQATRLAITSHTGIARAIVPSHTPFDGDVVFSVATGARKLNGGDADILELCHAAASCLSRAIARGVYEAEPNPSSSIISWKAKYSTL